MNTFAAVMLLFWVAGWTLAMVRTGLQVRAVAITGVPRRELPPASGLTNR